MKGMAKNYKLCPPVEDSTLLPRVQELLGVGGGCAFGREDKAVNFDVTKHDGVLFEFAVWNTGGRYLLSKPVFEEYEEFDTLEAAITYAKLYYAKETRRNETE